MKTGENGSGPTRATESNGGERTVRWTLDKDEQVEGKLSRARRRALRSLMQLSVVSNEVMTTLGG